MKAFQFRLLIVFAMLPVISASLPSFAQSAAPSEHSSFEISEVDGMPVLLKHLPEADTAAARASITSDVSELKRLLGDRGVLNVLELTGGAEAAVAEYPAGKLLLVEFQTPQASSAADEAISRAIAGEPRAVYRRIGNYNAIFFDVTDEAAAGSLLDQIKYEKNVQWLGEDPFLLQKFERYVATTGRDVAISTVIFITGIFLTAIGIGVATGYAYFRFREQERRTRTAFSDAGGLTRLNLDELSE